MTSRHFSAIVDILQHRQCSILLCESFWTAGALQTSQFITTVNRGQHSKSNRHPRETTITVTTSARPVFKLKRKTVVFWKTCLPKLQFSVRCHSNYVQYLSRYNALSIHMRFRQRKIITVAKSVILWCKKTNIVVWQYFPAREPSWCKSERMTAVCVRRSLAKKSTANKPPIDG